tara:strand:+ start:353 stop:616 length:264 start_codon:yes stop_codon:yes gene_type:complete
MIVIDTHNYVVGSAPLIYRVDAEDQIGLIKVDLDETYELDFYYIGTEDRDLYEIIDGTQVPDPNQNYYYVNGEYIPAPPPLPPGPTG